MEEEARAGNIDHPETAFRSPPATDDVHEETGSAGSYSLEEEAKRPALSERLTEAFREGVAAARPDRDPRPDVGSLPPRAGKKRQESSEAGIREKVIREGGAVGDKAAGVLGAFVELVRKAPALTQKYTEAFREGAASVQQRKDRTWRAKRPTAATEKGARSDGREILAKVFKAGESAAGFVREAVSVVKPGEIIGARQKIHLSEKKIDQLYIDIGVEAAGSWSTGQVETEKLSALLDELRKNEEKILHLRAHLAEGSPTGKAGVVRSPHPVKKEAASTPRTDHEECRAETGDSGAKPDEPVLQPDHPGEGEAPWQENLPDVASDVAPESADSSVSAEPDSEAPASHTVTEDPVDAKAAPEAPASDAAPEDPMDAEAARPEGSDGAAGRALREEPEVSGQKKRRGWPPDGGGELPVNQGGMIIP